MISKVHYLDKNLLVKGTTKAAKLLNAFFSFTLIFESEKYMSYNPLTILMADDDFEDMELMEDAIAKVEPKAVLHKVSSGMAAINYLRSQPESELPCLIILDYNMPGLKGSEVLALICKDHRYKNIPKVILSTSDTKAFIEECIHNGATEYFVKPGNLDDLLGIAKRMLEYCDNTAN